MCMKRYPMTSVTGDTQTNSNENQKGCHQRGKTLVRMSRSGDSHSPKSNRNENHQEARLEVTQTTEMRGGLSFTTHVKHACLWKKACPACVTAWVQTLASNDKIQLEINFFLYVVVVVVQFLVLLRKSLSGLGYIDQADLKTHRDVCACLCLPRAGIKGVRHCAQQE